MTEAMAAMHVQAKMPVRGLYAVTPDIQSIAELLAQVDAAIEGGAHAVQYRNKTASRDMKLDQARALVGLCRRHQVPLIINDSSALAIEVAADGCHLGRDDGPVESARMGLGQQRILGISCYDALELALAARSAGADYVAFGSVFASSSKPLAKRAPLALFQEARRAGVDCALVGIGGIDADNLDALIAAGADAGAVISALFGPTPEATRANARRLAARFESQAAPLDA